MGFGREVNNHVMAREHLVKEVAVADIALHEGVAGVISHGRQVCEVARVGELVVDGDTGYLGAVLAREQLAHKVGADEPGRAGDKITQG